MTPRSFANQDLRNRSFRGRSLLGVDFSGSDLRGCDFSHAKLAGANFRRVRTGRSLRQMSLLLIIVLAPALVVADASSRLVFASLGQTAAERAWVYVLVLHGCLALSGLATSLRIWLHQHRRAAQLTSLLSAALTSALVGFCYGGILAGEQASAAVRGAIVGSLLGASLGFRFPTGLGALVITTAGAVTAYGFAFLIGTTGLALLNAGIGPLGVGLTGLALVFLGLTLVCLKAAIEEGLACSGTRFCYADLTDTQFDAAVLQQANFRGALNPPAG